MNQKELHPEVYRRLRRYILSKMKRTVKSYSPITHTNGLEMFLASMGWGYDHLYVLVYEAREAGLLNTERYRKLTAFARYQYSKLVREAVGQFEASEAAKKPKKKGRR